MKAKPTQSASELPRKPRQLSLSDSLPVGDKTKSGFSPRITHGGQEAKGKRKVARPFTTHAPLHIVLKSSRAKGLWSLRHRKHQSKISSMVYVYAKRFRVQVYRFANVGNHLHLLVKANDRKDMADYLRVLAGRVAITVSGAQKHVKRIGKFWDHLCWSRLVKWGQEFGAISRYVFANEVETIHPGFKGMIMKPRPRPG
jgi:REP element-mobilizing transposase RayT